MPDNKVKTRLVQTALFAASLLSLPFKGKAAAAPDAAPAPDSGTAATTLPLLTVTGSSERPSMVLSGKYSGPLVYTPQSATVVDQQTMQAQGVTTMRDALRDVSGISLAAGEFSQQGDTLTVDGFSINHDFFIDGLRDFGSYYRDPFDTQQVEVLKGPSGLLFGNGTTGGAVNQASKQPQMEPLAQVSLAVGSDATRRASADLDEPLPALGAHSAFRLNVVAEQGSVAERNVTQNTVEGLAPSLAFGIGGPTRLDLTYFHLAENDVPDYGLPWLENAPAPVDRQNYYGFADDYLRASVDLIGLKLEHDFNDSLKVAEQARYGNYSRNVRITEPQISAAQAGSVTAGTLGLDQVQVTPNALTVYSTEVTFDNLDSLTAKFGTLGAKHSLQVGAEEVIETSNPIQSKYSGVPTQSLTNPNENLNFTAAGYTVSSKVSAQVSTLAAYLLDAMDMGQYWQLIGGLRYDHAESSLSNAVGLLNFTQVDNTLNWKAGLVFKPRKESSIYLASGSSSDPSAENLALSTATTGMPPTKTSTLEFGTKWGLLDNQLYLTGSAFWNEMDNALVEDPANPGADIPAGVERARGFDLGVSGYVVPAVEIQAGYTYLDSEYLSYASYSNSTHLVTDLTGDALRNAPTHTVNLWATYDVGAGFQLGAGLNAVTDRNGGKLAPNGLLESVPGYISYRAMLGYKFSEQFSIQANLNNLTDADYIDQVHPGHLVPGEGRNVQINSNLKF